MDGQSTKVLPASVGCLKLRGLARDNAGNEIELTIPCHLDTTRVIGASDHTTPSFLSPSPFQGDSALSLSIIEEIHSDDYATVYRVRVSDKGGVDGLNTPLVIKVAAMLNGKLVADEGGIYNALRPQQRNTVPQCYGYFRTQINHQEMTIKPWDPTCDNKQPRPELDIFDMPNVASSLNILLLEEVGQNVIERTPLDLNRESFRNGLLNIYGQLIQCNITLPWPPKLEKVCWASSSSSESPGPFSQSNSVYEWRLVGFGGCTPRGSQEAAPEKQLIKDYVDGMMQMADMEFEWAA